jgi:DNA-binding transcriptional ArsR family regulator
MHASVRHPTGLSKTGRLSRILLCTPCVTKAVMEEDRAFEALADPTRRRIIELLADREMTAGEIADRFPISRPAVSRHLRVLRESGLVRCRGEAQRRLYGLEAAPLAAPYAWLGRYQGRS